MCEFSAIEAGNTEMSVLSVERLLMGVATFALMTGLAATPAFAVSTLEEALTQSYETNPTLLAERARLRATDEGVAQAVSNWRPTVTATGTISDTETRVDPGHDGNPFTNTATTGTDPMSGNVTASQSIFRGFRSINQVRQAQAGVRAGRANLHSVEQEVLLSAVTAYTDVIRDEAVVSLRENNVSVLARQLEASQDRFDLGDTTRTDVAQSEARHSRARSNLTVSEAQLTASRASFTRVVGSDAMSLQDPGALPTVPSSEAEALQRALSNNPTLQAAVEAEIVSRRAVDIAVGALLPSVRVDGTLAHNEDRYRSTGQVDTATVSGVLTVPLYQSGAEHSAIRAARQTNSADRIRIVETERLIREAVANSWEGLRSAQSVIVSSAEQVRANEIAFEGVQQEAQVGSRTTLDVLDAEQELLDSRVALVQAERNERVAAYSLLAATGQLTAQDLGLPVQLYDATRHYRTVRWLPLGFGIGN